MPQNPGDDGDDRSRKVVLLRDYARTMGERVASLRRRTNDDATGGVLIEAFQELEITHEELTVAGEEISSAEARFEEALRALEARARHYSQLFDGAPEGYVLTDALGIVREANRTFSAMIGVPTQLLEGKPLVNFVARKDVPTYRDWLGALRRSEKDVGWIPLRLRPRGGEPMFVAETLARVVRGIGHHLTSIRWSMRRELARAGT